MKEQLVSFETAKLAKEKGFDLPDHLPIKAYNHPDCIGAKSIIPWEKEKYKDLVLAPTQSLLQRWLREVHRIRVYPVNKYAGDFGFDVYIVNPVEDERVGKPWLRMTDYWTQHYPTYEEALEQGLMEGLKLII